jgi:misacylated tRNA(Ala) deacylase
MKSDDLFRADAYLRSCEAKVLGFTPEGGVILDRTVFYAQGGGQPGDRGVLMLGDGIALGVTNTVYAPDRLGIAHLLQSERRPLLGETVTLTLDWETRFARMRVHTALHLLSVALPYPVTGGQIGDSGEGRLDFDIPEAGLDKDEIAERINAFIASDAAVSDRWITDEELDANPTLVKTMKVQPPRGTGRVRLVEIDGIDLQPCGGTHVRYLSEIGAVAITDIEKKGKQNRRVRLKLV